MPRGHAAVDAGPGGVMAKPIPTTITQLRKVVPGWRLRYRTHWVVCSEEKRTTAHRIDCWPENMSGDFWGTPLVVARKTNKAAAVKAAYAAMKTMEVRDAE